MDYKLSTKQCYNQFADEFEKKFKDFLQENLYGEIDEFCSRLPKGAKILDIGSGPGDHALVLQEKGFEVTCLDISEEMVRKCRDKGLKAVQMDFEKLGFPSESFDAVWTYTALLHIPKKNLPKALAEIANVVKKSGIVFLGMKAGEGEDWQLNPEKYPGTKRWFSLYSDEELRKYLEPLFRIEYRSVTELNPEQIYLNYVLGILK